MPLEEYDGYLDLPTMNIDYKFAHHPIHGATHGPETALSNATINSAYTEETG